LRKYLYTYNIHTYTHTHTAQITDRDTLAGFPIWNIVVSTTDFYDNFVPMDGVDVYLQMDTCCDFDLSPTPLGFKRKTRGGLVEFLNVRTIYAGMHVLIARFAYSQTEAGYLTMLVRVCLCVCVCACVCIYIYIYIYTHKACL
jgi:hypothetical protein